MITYINNYQVRPVITNNGLKSKEAMNYHVTWISKVNIDGRQLTQL